jgi:hypothetical protein
LRDNKWHYLPEAIEQWFLDLKKKHCFVSRSYLGRGDDDEDEDEEDEDEDEEDEEDDNED